MRTRILYNDKHNDIFIYESSGSLDINDVEQREIYFSVSNIKYLMTSPCMILVRSLLNQINELSCNNERNRG